MINYDFTKELSLLFEKAGEIVAHELENEGFGTLTRIEIKEKFKEKLDIHFKKYVILGVCDFVHACKAILVEEDIGLMFPCNIIVYERGNKTAISIIKPTAAMEMINNEELGQLAIQVEQQLKKVFNLLN